MYNKRPGTSGIRGQLYETKLTSLIYFRAIQDDSIQSFCLGTNIDKIGAFDDICFKIKLKGCDRPVAVFIQAKHRDNDKITLNTKKDLGEYFNSYLKIRRTFEPRNKDALFEGKFDETDCHFVVYTTVTDDVGHYLFESSFASNLYNLIGTGDTAKQPCQSDENIEFLCKIAMKQQITALAGQMVKYIFDENNLDMLLTDELMLRFHVILAQKVLDVSEIQPEGHRMASFRKDFFDTNIELLNLLKSTLYKEILKIRKLEDTEINNLLLMLLNKSSEITIPSKPMENIIEYKNSQFEFVNKLTSENLKRLLNEAYLSQSTVNKAVELTAKEMLSSRKFKVPSAFGNYDLTIRGNDVKVEKRLNHLSTRILDLLSKSNPNNIVTIDESSGNGFLQINGGIAGAVGNILVFDEKTNLYKFTDNCETHKELALRLLEKLRNKIPNLQIYRIEVKVEKFPILSFNYSEHDKCLARDFLSRLLLYTNQADETGVEKLLKSEIEDDQCNNGNTFRIKTDAIFLKYHDEIQKWWMLSREASYLTKETKIYGNAITDIVKDPLMSLIHMIYMDKIKTIGYTFNEEAMSCLKLQDKLSETVIVTKSIALTVAKLAQCFVNKDFVVLDLKYILNLPMYDRNVLYAELTNTDKEKILILVGEAEVQNSRNKALEKVAEAVRNRKHIIITNQVSFGMIKKYFSRAGNVVYDQRNKLIDMSEESKKSILENASLIFQGREVSLDLIVDNESLAFVEGDILKRIIGKETVVVGNSIGDSKYDLIKHFHVDRRIKKSESMMDKVIDTLNDMLDDVVVIIAKPGMGKSTLLTHLSIKTKEIDPKLWIVRINLLEYSREFSKWKEEETAIDLLTTLNFIIRYVILSEKNSKWDEVAIALEELNGIVYLKDCTGDDSTVFEIKMFLHFYNSKKLIFLFDGFDEICPHYMHEVLQCLKSISYPRKHRIWVTSRPYNEIKYVLEQEFGKCYGIEHFSYRDQNKYLKMFWKSNLILKDLNGAQLDNVSEFIEFVSNSQIHSHRGFESPLLQVYINAVSYLKNEINFLGSYLWRHNLKINDLSEKNHTDIMDHIDGQTNSEVGIPLHLYLIADYCQNELKYGTNKSNKWNLEYKTFTIYERFLETKLKKIRFQEKNQMNVHNPDIMITYEKEHADFIIKHKILAAYAIFHQYNNELFNIKELKDIEKTIQLILQGGEKTGFICGVANNIPIFVHRTFAEYFAVEYICDLLKKENCKKKQITTINFIFTEMFFHSSTNVLELFDSKIKMDKGVTTVLMNNKKVIFDLLTHQSGGFDTGDEWLKRWCPQEQDMAFKPRSWLERVVSDCLNNVLFLFFSIVESHLNKENLDYFIIIVSRIFMFPVFLIPDCDELIIFAVNIVSRIDKSKMQLLCDRLVFFPRYTNIDEMSNAEIADYIHKMHEQINYISHPLMFKEPNIPSSLKIVC